MISQNKSVEFFCVFSRTADKFRRPQPSASFVSVRLKSVYFLLNLVSDGTEPEYHLSSYCFAGTVFFPIRKQCIMNSRNSDFNILWKFATVSKLANLVEGNMKAPFSIPTTPKCREGATPFSRFLHLTLDPYLIKLSVRQGDIKYHFLCLWYGSTWDWTRIPDHWRTLYS